MANSMVTLSPEQMVFAGPVEMQQVASSLGQYASNNPGKELGNFTANVLNSKGNGEIGIA